MDRRAFLAGMAGGLLAAPVAAEAQQPGKLIRIGVLSPFAAPAGPSSAVDAFRDALRELGYVEGKNLALEYRYAGGKYEQLPILAAELVRLRVDVIFTSWGTPSALAAKNATQTIPVVFTGIGDAIGVGLVPSLSHPGANVTGLTLISVDTVGKQLELLKEAVPKMTRVAVFSNPSNPVYGPVLQDIERMGRTLGVQIQRLGVRDRSEFERAFADLTKERAGGMVVLRDAVFILNQAQFLELAAKHRLPAMYGLREFVDAGGLMSFGPNFSDMYRRSAFYVDKILKGRKPGDLPVEQATKFELVINLKTAKALGLTIPQLLLLRADQVIE